MNSKVIEIMQLEEKKKFKNPEKSRKLMRTVQWQQKNKHLSDLDRNVSDENENR